MDFQSDFAGRVDWCTANDDSAANHVPTLDAPAGIVWWQWQRSRTKICSLTGGGASRPIHAGTAGRKQDGRRESQRRSVSERCLRARKDGKLGSIESTGADQAQVHVIVPEDGDTIHMIAEVQDDGAHALQTLSESHHDRGAGQAGNIRGGDRRKPVSSPVCSLAQASVEGRRSGFLPAGLPGYGQSRRDVEGFCSDEI